MSYKFTLGCTLVATFFFMAVWIYLSFMCNSERGGIAFVGVIYSAMTAFMTVRFGRYIEQ